MSRTTEWFLDLQDKGLVNIYQSVIESPEQEEVELLLTPKMIENDN